MDMEKWIEENVECLADFNGNEAGDVNEAILVNDLRQLLKTHTIVPNEPTEAMLNIVRLDYGGSGYSFIKTYEAMLKASQFKPCHHQ